MECSRGWNLEHKSAAWIEMRVNLACKAIKRGRSRDMGVNLVCKATKGAAAEILAAGTGQLAGVFISTHRAQSMATTGHK